MFDLCAECAAERAQRVRDEAQAHLEYARRVDEIQRAVEARRPWYRRCEFCTHEDEKEHDEDCPWPELFEAMQGGELGMAKKRLTQAQRKLAIAVEALIDIARDDNPVAFAIFEDTPRDRAKKALECLGVEWDEEKDAAE
jgi:hypothetical protein